MTATSPPRPGKKRRTSQTEDEAERGAGKTTPEGVRTSEEAAKRAWTPTAARKRPAPADISTSPRSVSPPVKLRRTTGGVDSAERDQQDEAAPRVPLLRLPSLEKEDVPKENREEEELPAAGSSEDADGGDDDAARRQALLRASQVTPPPSARMLDKKNPPPPPQRPRRRRFLRRNANPVTGVGVTYARSFPRLALSPLDSPPSSPVSHARVFRSLADDFALAVQETPQQPRRVRPAPRMARGSRRSTRAGDAGGSRRRSIDTPTSTMVLRSRQLNQNAQPSVAKPENDREREQREFHERERRNT